MSAFLWFSPPLCILTSPAPPTQELQGLFLPAKERITFQAQVMDGLVNIQFLCPRFPVLPSEFEDFFLFT